MISNSKQDTPSPKATTAESKPKDRSDSSRFKCLPLNLLLVSALFVFNSCSSFTSSVDREIAEPDGEFQSADIVGSEGSSGRSNLRSRANNPSGMDFDWPVDSAKLTRGFLPKKRRPHWGLDLAAPRGTPILSAQAGRVIYTGRDFRGYGKMILIEDNNGWATLYAHLDKFYVSEGQKVKHGELIGAMGRTGRASGYHLHFEIREGKTPRDPLPLLPVGEQLIGRN